ncbi:MAG: DALR anticodon-binding domain-containing protein [Ignavibacteriales bacterium]|nr:DALR anticodon-binding domain-containing protein [Ignavibacteriales bacterium]
MTWRTLSTRSTMPCRSCRRRTNTIRNARLRLVAAAKQTIVNALRLLEIQSPDVM